MNLIRTNLLYWDTLTSNLHMGSKFNCQRCGACCRLAGCSDIPEIKAMADEGTDVCRHLLPNNLCAIYETRPWFCRVDETYERIIKPQGISLEEWHEKNHASCEMLRRLLGIYK